ncbi:MAG: carboxypeptidase-like regulatory domain-containing protein [Acidobacteriaceae bacterium]|nr:carboxypeptidase-like regulatory domain-containing protein [Acidobacteriaceae bacterium]
MATVVFGGAYNGDRVAPHRTILGEVKDGKPVDRAMVYLKDVNNSSLRVQRADENGAYRFGPLPLSDDYELWAEIDDRRTPKKPVSSFITTNPITVPLRFLTASPHTDGRRVTLRN